ncbi:MAG: hypothetical protein ABW133_19785, partial [Polyangiaceae bacterium]
SWSVRLAPSWIMTPSEQLVVGDHVLRYQEPCDGPDAAYPPRPRPHLEELSFRFSDEAPLPTTAGTLELRGALEKIEFRQSIRPNGACRFERVHFVKVTGTWSIAPEAIPFLPAMQAIFFQPNGLDRYHKDYGTNADGPTPLVMQASIGCDPASLAMNGFAGGVATANLLSHLAGARESLPMLVAELRLDCPPVEDLGPCDDSGVGDPDASTPPDPTPRPDASLDHIDDSSSSTDVSADGNVVDPTLPPEKPDGGGCACALGAPGHGAATHGSLGGIAAALMVGRMRRFRRSA